MGDSAEVTLLGGHVYINHLLYRVKKCKMCLLRADSHKRDTLEQVKAILDGREIVFLFIDGDHTYEGVKRYFEMYRPLVKKRGIIAFRDIAPRGWESVGGSRSFGMKSQATIATKKEK